MIFKNFIKKLVFPSLRERLVKAHELNYLFWECTLRCNLHCLHCGSDCLCDSSVKDMPHEDFLAVLDKVRPFYPCAMVCITGGEPLMRSDLEEAGRKISDKGFAWGIVSNGMLLSRQRFESLIASGMRSISLSLDGFEEDHAYLRQNESSFARTTEALRMLVEYERAHPGRIAFDVITCVHAKNIDSMERFRDFLLDMGIRNWRIFTVFPEGRAAQNALTLNPASYRALMDFIKKSRSKIHVNYSCEGWLGKYELKVRDVPFFCRSGINVASVMCDGSITGCLSVRGTDFVQGNIYRDDFMEVWQKGFGLHRDRSWARKDRCAGCRHWKNCLGNALHLHHSLDSPLPYCNCELLK